MIARALGRTLEPLRAEGGFTLVETVVAALLVSLASIGVLATLDTSRRATYRAEQSQVATDIAQRELEAIRALDDAKVALTSMPTPSGEASDPRSRVSGAQFALDSGGGSPAELVVNGGVLNGPLLSGGILGEPGTISGGVVDPGPTPFQSGDVTGKIHRFVVWRNDPNCLEVVCPGSQDYKRVVVAVSLDSGLTGGNRSYVEAHTDVIDPDDTVLSDVTPDQLGGIRIAKQFWLSDRRCQLLGEPEPSMGHSSHQAHDTHGVDCLPTTSNRPKALLLKAPERVTPPEEPPLPVNPPDAPDFSTDVGLPGTPDAGLQLLSSPGCQFRSGGNDAHLKNPIWVSRKLTDPFAFSAGTLEIWSRTITNDIVTPARVCATVFTRVDGVDNSSLPLVPDVPPVDVPMIDQSTGNPYFTHELPVWPRNDWGRIRIPLQFAELPIDNVVQAPVALPGQRIGVAISLQQDNAHSDHLMFQYDHIDLDSRLELETDINSAELLGD